MFVSALVVVLIMLLMCAKDSYKLYYPHRLLHRLALAVALTMVTEVVLVPNLVITSAPAALAASKPVELRLWLASLKQIQMRN